MCDSEYHTVMYPVTTITDKSWERVTPRCPLRRRPQYMLSIFTLRRNMPSNWHNFLAFFYNKIAPKFQQNLPLMLA